MGSCSLISIPQKHCHIVPYPKCLSDHLRIPGKSTHARKESTPPPSAPTQYMLTRKLSASPRSLRTHDNAHWCAKEVMILQHHRPPRLEVITREVHPTPYITSPSWKREVTAYVGRDGICSSSSLLACACRERCAGEDAEALIAARCNLGWEGGIVSPGRGRGGPCLVVLGCL